MSKFGYRDVAILFVTMLLTVFFDLTYGVIGGFVLTILVNAKNLKTGLKIEKIENQRENCLEYSLKGSLHFITVNKLITKICKDYKDASEIILNLEEVRTIDLSSIEKLSGFNKTLDLSDKKLVLNGYNDKIKRRLNLYY
jgi:SulP family sulfate permease